jgi:hypothetical protein
MQWEKFHQATHMQRPTEEHWKAIKKIVGYMKSENFLDMMILKRPKIYEL